MKTESKNAVERVMEISKFKDSIIELTMNITCSERCFKVLAVCSKKRLFIDQKITATEFHILSTQLF